MAENEILSQATLDELLSTTTAETEKKDNITPNPGSDPRQQMKTYDFIRPDFISDKARRSLNSFFERYSIPLGHILCRHTKLQAEVKLKSVDTLNFKEYIPSIDTPCAYYECHLAASVVICLEICDLNIPGFKKAGNSSLQGTELSRLVQNIITGFFKKKKPALKNFKVIHDPADIKPENNLEMLLVTCYEIKLTERSYGAPQTFTLKLIFPRYTLTRIIPGSSSRRRSRSSRRPAEREDITIFQISAGPVQHPLAALKRGGSILLKHKVAEPLMLQEKKTGEIIARGELVVADDCFGLRILELYEPETAVEKTYTENQIEVILGEYSHPASALPKLSPGTVIKSQHSIYSAQLLKGVPGCNGYVEAVQKKGNEESGACSFRIVNLNGKPEKN